MRLISLDELIFGELTEFQMQAVPSFAPVSVHEQESQVERETDKHPHIEVSWSNEKRINLVTPKKTSIAMIHHDTIHRATICRVK